MMGLQVLESCEEGEGSEAAIEGVIGQVPGTHVHARIHTHTHPHTYSLSHTYIARTCTHTRINT